jgi:phosphoribosylaminoimidazole-succinocarboxamide synthase
VEKIVGKSLAQKLRTLSIAIYKKARDYAERRGILIDDTKIEFGMKDGEPLLIDELLTLDSSRFWPKDEYRPGAPQKNFDKQYLRGYPLSIHWDKTPPATELSEEVIQRHDRNIWRPM